MKFNLLKKLHNFNETKRLKLLKLVPTTSYVVATPVRYTFLIIALVLLGFLIGVIYGKYVV